MACSLTGLALIVAVGMSSAAEPVAPARAFPHAKQSDAVFISSKKDLPPPPATLAKPVSVPSTPVKALPAEPAPLKLPPPVPMNEVVMPTQVVEPQTPPVAEPPSVIDGLRDYQILLEPPSPEALFGRLDSEKMLEKRMRQQGLQRNPPENVQFPTNPPLTNEKYQARSFAPQTTYEEPSFVTYDRLYFQDKNAERYGWDLGFIQPILSTARFYGDVALLPFRFAAQPCSRFDTSAGECLPGDPVPYTIYPPGISVFSCWQ